MRMTKQLFIKLHKGDKFARSASDAEEAGFLFVELDKNMFKSVKELTNDMLRRRFEVQLDDASPYYQNLLWKSYMPVKIKAKKEVIKKTMAIKPVNTEITRKGGYYIINGKRIDGKEKPTAVRRVVAKPVYGAKITFSKRSSRQGIFPFLIKR